MPFTVVFGRARFSSAHHWDALAGVIGQSLSKDLSIIAVDEDQLAAVVGRADVVVPLSAQIDARLIAQGDFGLIHQFGVGVDRIDVEAATHAGVWVANVPALNSKDVAEQAIMLLLATLRRLPEVDTGFQPGHWGEPPGRALIGSRVCIVGLGAIGGEVARRLVGFEVELTGVRRYVRKGPPAGVPEMLVFAADRLQEAVSAADIVILAAEHRPGHPPLMDGHAIAAMPQGSYLVNVGRGHLVDESALLAALRDGRIAGAGLDVFTQEPYPAHGPLRTHPQVVVTPHNAAITGRYFDLALRAIAEGIAAFTRGERPPNAVNELTGPPRPRVRATNPR